MELIINLAVILVNRFRRNRVPRIVMSKGTIDHSAQVLMNMEELCISDSYSDVTFVVQSERIPAHRLLLVSRCEYFRALLSGGLKESYQNEIALNTRLDTFKHVLRYIYTGSTDLNEMQIEEVLNLLELTHEYCLMALVEAISNYLYEMLSVENVCTILPVVLQLDLADLVAKCFDFIDIKARSVIQHDSFRKLPFDTLCKVLDRDSFNQTQRRILDIKEIEVFRTIQAWCANNSVSEERKKKLYDTVDFKLIPQQQLLNVVRPSGVLSPTELLDVINAQDNTSVQPWAINTAPGKNVAANAQEVWIMVDDHRYEVCFDLLKVMKINHVSFETRSGFLDMLGFGLSSKKPGLEILSVSKDGNAWTVVYETGVSINTGCYSCKITEKPWVIFNVRPVRFIRLETPFNYKQFNFAMTAMFK